MYDDIVVTARIRPGGNASVTVKVNTGTNAVAILTELIEIARKAQESSVNEYRSYDYNH